MAAKKLIFVSRKKSRDQNLKKLKNKNKNKNKNKKKKKTLSQWNFSMKFGSK